MVVKLTPELTGRLPIPGGLEEPQAVYTYLEDQPSLGRRFFAITKPDGNQSEQLSSSIISLTHILFSSIAFWRTVERRPSWTAFR